MTTSHPYYPKEAILSGEIFTPNTWSVFRLISTFAACWTFILLTTLIVVRRVYPQLKISDQALTLWFVLSKHEAAPHKHDKEMPG